ncbi:MAG: hypothetical protein ACK4NU_09955 [Brevundimonas sp.]
MFQFVLMASLEIAGHLTQPAVDRRLSAIKGLPSWLRAPAITLVIAIWLTAVLAGSLLVAAVVMIFVTILQGILQAMF